MDKMLTVIIPVIRPDLIERCLQTLYEYTEPNFYVYIIDQTVKGLDATKLRDTYKNLMVIRTPRSDVHHTGNLGFAQATNLGIGLVQTPYFMMCNDDVEFIHPKWWQGVIDTFAKVEEATPDRPAVIVNPSSLKLPDWSVGLPAGQDHYIIEYKEQYTDEDWNFLINEEHYVNQHLTIKPNTVIDGVTMYASVCDTRRFLEIGLLDEKYYPGSGEDYDYSCRAAMVGYRCVGTTLSYVFHHWSKTFKALQDEDDVVALQIPELNWNQTNEKWGDGFDIWGVKCPQCGKGMRCLVDDKTMAVCSDHPEIQYKMPESTVSPL
jgi:GT2 family glycosyltransferase